MAVCNRAVLNYDSIIGFGTSKNASSAKLPERTVRYMQIRLHSDYTSIVIGLIAKEGAVITVELSTGHHSNARYFLLHVFGH